MQCSHVTLACTHNRMHTQSHAHAHVHKHVHIHTNACARAHMFTCTHSLHVHMHAHTHVFTCLCAYTCSHAHTASPSTSPPPVTREFSVPRSSSCWAPATTLQTRPRSALLAGPAVPPRSFLPGHLLPAGRSCGQWAGGRAAGLGEPGDQHQCPPHSLLGARLPFSSSS